MRALAVVGLEEYAGTPADTLSLGEQRCLEIARAIVSKPKILLLDEPVSGLETAERKRLHELLVRINASFGVTMLIVEHNIPFVLGLCDHLSIMHNGAILADGIPEQVIAQKEVRQVYFGESARA
jgi:branched-chain amino acid transport system permease protein